GQTILGALPYSAQLAQADLNGQPSDVDDQTLADAVTGIWEKLQAALSNS
ncbi:MAG: hypothetical protein HQ581_23240, partial [Planctomycetes bacterium]|nr:hypothetical protein [Planctomycetota bacterium]